MGLLASQVSQGWKLKFGSRPILSLSVLFTRPALTQYQSIASKKKIIRLNINLMSSLKRTIWMQFSQGTKSNTEPFLKFADQTNQTKTYSIKTIQVIMVFFLGEGEGGGLILLYGICKLHQTQSNSIERKSLMEFRNQKVWWNSLGLCLKGTEKEIYEFIYLLSCFYPTV